MFLTKLFNKSPNVIIFRRPNLVAIPTYAKQFTEMTSSMNVISTFAKHISTKDLKEKLPDNLIT